MGKRSNILDKILLSTLMLSLCFLCVFPAVAQTDQQSSKLQAADTAVNQAFNAVFDAEKSGANVTNLLVQINTAQGILAQAENSYRNGDSNTVSTQADSVLAIAQQITNQAQDAKQNAIVSSQNDFWSTIGLTAIGIFVFVLALFLVWRRFKRNYIESLSKAKPEVIEQ